MSSARASAAAIVLLALLRGWDRVRAAPPHHKTILAACAFGALLAFACFYNLGRPQFWHHGERRPMFVHVADMRIYQPFAKYFAELRYDGVYLASVLAVAEDEHGGSSQPGGDARPRHARFPHAPGARADRRDRQGQAAVHARRWAEFKRDMRSSAARWAPTS